MLSSACRCCTTAIAFLLVLSLSCSAQTAGPTSGEITVQLVQGLDSATNPKGMSQAIVTKSSNPAVPYKSAAMVGLGSDPINGGYTAKLVALIINGRTVPAASSDVVLAADINSKLPAFMRQQNKNAVSGNHVFLPTQTYIKFTLTEPPPKAVQAPPPTPVYAPVPAPTQPSIVQWSGKLSGLQTKDLAAACTAQDNAHQALCYGALMMFYDQSLAAADSETYQPSFCIPETATPGQLRDAFLDDARKRSDQVDSPISLFFYQTWENEFPCPKAPPKKRSTSRK